MLALEADRRLVDPNAAVLRITQERILEKTFVRECGIPTADFAPVRDRPAISTRQPSAIGFPAVLKTTMGGYDGKGQWVVRDRAREAALAWEAARGRALIWEQLIPFDRELSIIATRDEDGDVVTFPVSENVHDHGVLAMTIVPGRIAVPIADRAHAYAHTIAARLGIVGTFCVEFFQAGDDLAGQRDRAARAQQRPLLARRDADLAVRAARARDLRSAAGRTEAVRAGRHDQYPRHGSKATGSRASRDILRDPDLKLHIYGKAHAALRRKMAHFTVLGETIDDAIARAERGAQSAALGRRPRDQPQLSARPAGDRDRSVIVCAQAYIARCGGLREVGHG